MDSIQKTSPLKESAILLLKGETPGTMRIADAWFEGTSIQKALKLEPKKTRAWLVAEVAKLCKQVDAKKTLQNDEEIAFCCRSIIEEHPTIKMEEVHLAFNLMKKGKMLDLFERLKTPEILKILRIYEGDYRAEEIEKRHKQQKEQFKKEQPQRKLEPLNLAQLVEDSPPPTPEGLGTRLRNKNGWHDKIEIEKET